MEINKIRLLRTWKGYKTQEIASLLNISHLDYLKTETNLTDSTILNKIEKFYNLSYGSLIK
jgi:hypothetical protein